MNDARKMDDDSTQLIAIDRTHKAQLLTNGSENSLPALLVTNEPSPKFGKSDVATLSMHAHPLLRQRRLYALKQVFSAPGLGQETHRPTQLRRNLCVAGRQHHRH